MQIGTEVEDKVLDKRQKGMAINQCATLVYTSGTTGMPKGNNKLIEMLMFFGSSNFYWKKGTINILIFGLTKLISGFYGIF